MSRDIEKMLGHLHDAVISVARELNDARPKTRDEEIVELARELFVEYPYSTPKNSFEFAELFFDYLDEWKAGRARKAAEPVAEAPSPWQWDTEDGKWSTCVVSPSGDPWYLSAARTDLGWRVGPLNWLHPPKAVEWVAVRAWFCDAHADKDWLRAAILALPEPPTEAP